MPHSLKGRRDLTDMGRTMALEMSDILASHLGTIAADHPAGLTDEHLDLLIAKQMQIVDETAASLLREGATLGAVLRFRGTFLRTAGERMGELSLAAAVPAGEA